MEFIDRTGHIFSLPSYQDEPVGYEFNENPYIFWVDDEYTNKLSINNYYIKPIRCMILGNGERGLATDEEGLYWDKEEIGDYFYDRKEGRNLTINDSSVRVYWNNRISPIWYDDNNRWTNKLKNTKHYKIQLSPGRYIRFLIKDYNKFCEDKFVSITGKLYEPVSINEIKESLQGNIDNNYKSTIEDGTSINISDINLLLYIDDLYRIKLQIEGKGEIIRWNEVPFNKDVFRSTEDLIKYNNTIKSLSIKSDSEVYKLLGSKDIQDLIEGNKSFKEYVELDEDMFKTELTLDDVYLVSDLYINENTNYIMIPFYVVAKASDPGTWVSNILVNVNYIEEMSEYPKEFCPISVGGVFEDEYEELIINGKNFNIEIPKDILKSIYQNSFYNEFPNETLYNEKLKELLLNYMNIRGEVGNYRSMIHSLQWFGYGDKVKLSALWQNDNEFMNQYLHDYFDINDDFIYSFKHFRNSTYVALRMKENQETNIYEKQRFDKEWMWGEGKPLLENLFQKNIVVTYDEGDIFFYRGYYDYIWEEMGLKLSILKYYYEKYFLPIHISVHSSTLAHQVHLNDMKLLVAPFNKITERPQYIEDYDIDVIFPTNSIQFFFNQLHYVDEYYNEYSKYYGNKKYFLLDTCLNIPIKFVRKSNYTDILYKEMVDEPKDTIYNCVMIVTKRKNNSTIKESESNYTDFNNNNIILLENHFTFCQKYDGKININDYENFVLYPNNIYKRFEKSNELQYLKGDWIDSIYTIYLNCNGKWFTYQFTSRLHELKYFISKIEYKYQYKYNGNDIGYLAYQEPGVGQLINNPEDNEQQIFNGEFVKEGDRQRVFINRSYIGDDNITRYVSKSLDQINFEENIINKYLNCSVNKSYDILKKDLPKRTENGIVINCLKIIYNKLGIEAFWGTIFHQYNQAEEDIEFKGKVNIYIEKVENNIEELNNIGFEVFTFTYVNSSFRYPFKQISYLDDDPSHKSNTEEWNPIVNFNSFMWNTGFISINNNNFIEDIITTAKHNNVKDIIENKTSLNILKNRQLYYYFIYNNVRFYVDSNIIYNLNKNKYNNIYIQDGKYYKEIILNHHYVSKEITDLSEIIEVNLFIPEKYINEIDSNSSLIIGMIEDDNKLTDSIYLIQYSSLKNYNDYKIIGKIDKPFEYIYEGTHYVESESRIKLTYTFPSYPKSEETDNYEEYIFKTGKINVLIYNKEIEDYENYILYSENFVDIYNILDKNDLYISNKNYLNHIVIFDIFDGLNNQLEYKNLAFFDNNVKAYNRYIYRIYKIFFNNSKVESKLNTTFEVQDIFSNNDDYYEYNLNDYDFYLMHDEKYWYGVFISKYTYYNIGTIYINDGKRIEFIYKYVWDEWDGISNYLINGGNNEINNSTVYPYWNIDNKNDYFDINNPDIFYDTNNTQEDSQILFYLKYSKSEYKFLINRFDLSNTFNSNSVNQYKPNDILCTQIPINNRIDLNTSTQLKWFINPVTNKENVYYAGNNEIFIFNYDGNMTKGYYDVRLQYSLAPYLSNKTFTSNTKIKIISN